MVACAGVKAGSGEEEGMRGMKAAGEWYVRVKADGGEVGRGQSAPSLDWTRRWWHMQVEVRRWRLTLAKGGGDGRQQ